MKLLIVVCIFALAAVVWAASAGSSAPAAPPPKFVAVFSAGTGTALQLRSAATGEEQLPLGTFGPALTNNGLAMSPNAHSVFYTLIGHGTRGGLLLEELDVANGTRISLGQGEDPAVSPNGRLLAYTTGASNGPETVTVRDLQTGRTRVVRVGALLGHNAEIVDAPLTWFADNETVAAVERRPAVAVSHVSSLRPAPLRLLIVHVGATALTVRQVTALKSQGASVMVVSADAASPGSVLAGAYGPRDSMTLERLTPRRSRLAVTHLSTIRSVLPLAFAPTGDALLYLRGQHPPALWVAGRAGGRLVSPRELLTDSTLQAAAW